MKKIILTLAVLALLFGAKTALAADTLVFDSTNNYLGACSLTDTSTWTLTADLNVTTFQLWYDWQTNETSISVTVSKDGATFAQFDATRSSCDPYQASWCNADYAINKVFPAGTYTTKIDNARQCLKPGGTGAVRLYANAAATGTNTNQTTNTNADLIAAANTNATTNLNLNDNVNAAANLNYNYNANANSYTNTNYGLMGYSPAWWLIIAGLGVIIVILLVIIFRPKK